MRVCRQEIAAREHMLVHGRPSALAQDTGPAAALAIAPADERASHVASVTTGAVSGNAPASTQLPVETEAAALGRDLSDSLARLEVADAGDGEDANGSEDPGGSKGVAPDTPAARGAPSSTETPPSIGAARTQPERGESSRTSTTVPAKPPVASPFAHPSNLSAQLLANPSLAALRSTTASAATGAARARPPPVAVPPMLLDAKCSGYFLEPVGSFLIDAFHLTRTQAC